MLNYYSYAHKTSSEWVTFVHGAGGSSSIWFKQVRDFRKHFNVLILDLRGHGDSKPTLKDTFNPKYTFDSITADIVEVIDHLKIEKSHFVGISLGTILDKKFSRKKARFGNKYDYGWRYYKDEFSFSSINESREYF